MLTSCPECGRQVSDRARTCPGCGYPVGASKHSASPPSSEIEDEILLDDKSPPPLPVEDEILLGDESGNNPNPSVDEVIAVRIQGLDDRELNRIYRKSHTLQTCGVVSAPMALISGAGLIGGAGTFSQNFQREMLIVSCIALLVFALFTLTVVALWKRPKWGEPVAMLFLIPWSIFFAFAALPFGLLLTFLGIKGVGSCHPWLFGPDRLTQGRLRKERDCRRAAAKERRMAEQEERRRAKRSSD